MKTPMILVFALFFAAISVALAKPGDISYQSTEVAPNIFMLEGVGGFTGGNLGILSGPDGVVLIDDGVLPLAGMTKAAIRKQVKKDVDYVVNTHAHGDHVGGNELISKTGATIVGHDKLRERLIAEGISGPEGQITANKNWLPALTYSTAMTMHLNGQRIHIFHAANAHTDGDSIVHFPDSDVIHSGDVVFNGLFPFIDHDSGGSVEGYVAGMKRVLSLAGESTKIIPGHGPLASKKDVQAAHDMLVDACQRVEQLIVAGKTEEEIMTLNPLADYDADWSWGFITTEKMTRTLIKDLLNR